MSTSLKFKKIEISKHESAQFAELFLFLSGDNNKKQKVYFSSKYELYLVKDLGPNMLIGNNIPTPKNFMLNIGLGPAVMGSCGIKITIKARQKGQFLRRMLLAENDGVILPRFEAMILFLPVLLPNNRNFLFHLAT